MLFSKQLKTAAVAILSVTAASFLTQGCTNAQNESAEYESVTITRGENNGENSVEVTFTPTEGTSEFFYAIGNASDIEGFNNDTMEDIVCISGNKPETVLFENLLPGKTYSVFAKAKGSDNLYGSTAVLKIASFDKYSVVPEYTLDKSAGITMSITPNYSRIEYYFGTAADKEGFINGEIERDVKSDINLYTVNYFDLTPDTEYVFYAYVYDRKEVRSDLIEIPVRTLRSEDAPIAEFSIDNINIFKGTYRLKPNAHCGRISAFVVTKGYHDAMIEGPLNWSGDVMNMIVSWSEIDEFQDVVTAVGEDCVLEYQTNEMKLDNPLEIYAVVCDKEMNPKGVQHFEFMTPSFNEMAPVPFVEISVSDITSQGAKYSFKPDSGTFGFFYETVEADWYDNLKESSDWNENYLANTLFQQGYFWQYGNEEVSFTETSATPNTRYYAAACPMNENGPEKGWGTTNLIEYTTKAN